MGWRRLIVVVVLLITSGGSTAWAQSLGTLLRPGRTVWITETGGQEEKYRIVELSGDVIVATANERAEQLRTSDIVRVRARHFDSVLNGALIGAGAAVATGLFLCTRTEPWENCRDDVGPMVGIGALGAGIGVGVDALIRPRRTIYEAMPRPVTLHVTPIVVPRAGGVRISVSY